MNVATTTAASRVAGTDYSTACSGRPLPDGGAVFATGSLPWVGFTVANGFMFVGFLGATSPRSIVSTPLRPASRKSTIL